MKSRKYWIETKQNNAKQRKTKLGDVEITTGELEDPESMPRNMVTYMDLLQTLMLAYSFAGAKAMSPLPANAMTADGPADA